MAPKPETIRKRMTRRVELAKKTHRLAEAHFDPESGAGVIVAQNSDGRLVALFFDPLVTRHFEEVEISTHERLDLGRILKKRIADQKALATAPHDLKLGDIFVHEFGSTMRHITFYRITGIPNPQKIAAVEIPSRPVWGDTLNGDVMPDLDAPLPEDAPEEIFPIVMEDGEPRLRIAKADWQICRGYRWDGKPCRSMTD